LRAAVWTGYARDTRPISDMAASIDTVPGEP
jgi:hypothetical protein